MPRLKINTFSEFKRMKNEISSRQTGITILHCSASLPAN